MTTAVDGGSIPPISTIGRCRALLEVRVITRKLGPSPLAEEAPTFFVPTLWPHFSGRSVISLLSLERIVMTLDLHGESQASAQTSGTLAAGALGP